MPPEDIKIRTHRRVQAVHAPGPRTTPVQQMPYVPDTVPIVDVPYPAHMTRVWLEWARQITMIAAGAAEGGTVAAHHATHETGGSDALTALDAGILTCGTVPDARLSANVLKHTGGYPGGTTNFLRADGTFTAPPSGTGDVVGPASAVADNLTAFNGTTGKIIKDSGKPLAQVPLKNLQNIFTQDQAIQKNSIAEGPALFLDDLSQAANARSWRMSTAATELRFNALNDDGSLLTIPLRLTRGGDAAIANGLNVNGSGGNVACKNQANIFTAGQQIRMASAPLVLHDTGQPADARVFQLTNNSQLLYFIASNDALTVNQAIPLSLNRGGDVLVGKDVYEKGRAVPMGHWQDVPYSAGNFNASGGMTWTVSAGNLIFSRYTVIGKTLIWLLYIEGASLSGTAGSQLYVALPPGCVGVSKRGVVATTQLFDGVHFRGWVRANTTYVIIEKDPPAALALNTGLTYVEFTISLEIN
jgi:hypothetical protein